MNPGKVNANNRTISRLITINGVIGYNKSTITTKNPTNPTKDG